MSKISQTAWLTASFSDEEVFRIPEKCHIAKEGETQLPLGEIKARLNRAYCGSIGVEFMHITSQEQKEWIRKKFESPGGEYCTPEEQRLTLERVIRYKIIFSCQKFIPEKLTRLKIRSMKFFFYR